MLPLTPAYFCLVLVLLPAVVAAHGNHASVVHLATLHVLPWLSDRPVVVVLLAMLYVLGMWWAWKRLQARAEAEEAERLGKHR